MFACKELELESVRKSKTNWSMAQAKVMVSRKALQPEATPRGYTGQRSRSGLLTCGNWIALLSN